MNRMWDRLRQEDGEVHREVSKVNAHKMQNSSVEVEKWGKGSEHSPKSFLTILRYFLYKNYYILLRLNILGKYFKKILMMRI